MSTVNRRTCTQAAMTLMPAQATKVVVDNDDGSGSDVAMHHQSITIYECHVYLCRCGSEIVQISIACAVIAAVPERCNNRHGRGRR